MQPSQNTLSGLRVQTSAFAIGYDSSNHRYEVRIRVFLIEWY